MEKVNLTVSIESVRLDALHFYLASKENTTPQKELEKMLVEMYEKYVPAETRQYLDSKLKSSGAAKSRPKRPAAKKNAPQQDNHTEVENEQ